MWVVTKKQRETPAMVVMKKQRETPHGGTRDPRFIEVSIPRLPMVLPAMPW